MSKILIAIYVHISRCLTFNRNFNSILRRDPEKNNIYERRDYDSVDEKEPT